MAPVFESGSRSALPGDVDVLPLQRHDLAEPAAGQDQQPYGGDRGGQFDAFLLHLAQHLADTPQLGGAQEPLALLLRIFLDVLARVRSVRTQAPHLGEVEHLGDDLQAPVGVVGDVPEIVMDLGDVGPRHLGHAMAPERRE